jgi:hypothetical protein
LKASVYAGAFYFAERKIATFWRYREEEMTTAAELIAYLQTLPPATQIQVLREVTHGYSCYAEWCDLDLKQHADFIDVVEPFLQLGGR